MTNDLTKFPFNALNNPDAPTLTEAISADPVDGGFVVITLKNRDGKDLTESVRRFAQQVRADVGAAPGSITAYRQLRREEMGGTVPYDQAFCESILTDIAARKEQQQADRFPGLASTQHFVLENEVADWVILVSYEMPDAAADAVQAWLRPDSVFAGGLGEHVDQYTINAFTNMKRYAHASLDPNAIQFFNLFPGPGNPDDLWLAWEEVLPRYFDAAEIRSSFPMKALNPDQPLILVNYAHADSMKHFLLSMVFDPNFLEDIARCYSGRGFGFPHPFFCKVVPV